MFELCRELGLTFEEVAVAIGWLARENKISFREKDNMLFVKIDDVEFSFWLNDDPAFKMEHPLN